MDPNAMLRRGSGRDSLRSQRLSNTQTRSLARDN